MKVIKTLLAIGVMTASFAPQAEVGLKFHEEISPIIVNNEEVGFRLFGTPEYKLENGSNQIVFRVSKLVEGVTSEKEKYNSKPYVMTFYAQDTDLVLSPNAKIVRTLHAKEFDKTPQFLLKDSSGSVVDFEFEVLPASYGLTRNYTKELAKYNKENGILLESSSSIIRSSIDSSDSGRMIEYWLQQATAEESEVFVNWAFENRTVANPQGLEGSKALNMLSHWYSEADTAQRKQILAWLIGR